MSNVDGSSTGARDSDEEERKVLVDVRSLLDQLHLDVGHALTLDSDLSNDLGVDSLALVELCDLLERSFDVSLPDEVFLTAATPRDWLASIQKAKGVDGPGASSPSESHDDDRRVR